MDIAETLHVTVLANVPESPEVVDTMVHNAVDFLGNEHVRHGPYRQPLFENIDIVVTTEPVSPVRSTVTGFGVAHLQYKQRGSVDIQASSTNEPHVTLHNLHPHQASVIEWVGQLEQLYHTTNTGDAARKAQIDYIDTHAPEAREQVAKQMKKK